MTEFYRRINFDREPERWHEWINHRNEINLLINKAMLIANGSDKVAILGAGNCDDLDLKYLSSLFHEILLVDMDGDSVQKAVNLQDPKVRKSIQIAGDIDFTKLDQMDFYNQFVSLLETKGSCSKICNFFIKIRHELDRYEVLSNYKGNFSVVISSAVYTQIFYIHALTILSPYVINYKAEEVQKLISEIVQLRNDILNNYNNMLLSLAQEGGIIIVWTDIVKLDDSNPFPEEQFYSQLSDDERMNIMFSMANKQGREAAVIGLKDLHDKLLSKGRRLAIWRWPFNSNRHYITFGLSGKKGYSRKGQCL